MNFYSLAGQVASALGLVLAALGGWADNKRNGNALRRIMFAGAAVVLAVATVLFLLAVIAA
jgi:hypothetical protein